MKFALSFLLGLVGAVASAIAAPVSYNISFTTTSGIAPASGSFTYDSATQTFSAFSVSWNGRSFDLTSSANSPSVFGACDTAAPNSADYFGYLGGSACLPAIWAATTNFNTQFSPLITSSFTLGGSQSGAAFANATIQEAGGDGQPIAQFGGGAFTISTAAAQTPEPSSLVLLLGSGAVLVGRRRRGAATEKVTGTN